MRQVISLSREFVARFAAMQILAGLVQKICRNHMPIACIGQSRPNVWAGSLFWRKPNSEASTRSGEVGDGIEIRQA
jgi:hypothetical protein